MLMKMHVAFGPMAMMVPAAGIGGNKSAVQSSVYEMCFSDVFSAYNLLRELGG